jgi:hypothetical protein
LLYSLYSSLPIHQNPFLCLFVDIYTTALYNDQHQPERFVISVILNGEGEEVKILSRKKGREEELCLAI